MMTATTPFHAGELKAQARVGATDVSAWASGFIRPFMPDQHRAFYSQLPFLVVSGADAEGQHWVTLLDGPDGFISSPNPGLLSLAARPDPQDPLAAALAEGTDIGVLGIELATRRRNRLSGRARAYGDGYAIDIRQSFGNCPQYIHEREWRRVPKTAAPPAIRSTALNDDQITRIRAADTLFLGTGQHGHNAHASDGFDASHRGGAPGFVAVTSRTHLRIPDYAGNNFFNTIGNLLENPRIGLVFVDFETGGLLHVTGRAEVDWQAKDTHDPAARRMINVDIDAVIDRPAALSLRWSKNDTDLRDMVVTKKVYETEDIASFYLAADDGSALAPFEAGQHRPIELNIPGQPDRVRRSYSLSGSPYAGTYRLTVKRESKGLASRFLHDKVDVGDRLQARPPSGDFIRPKGSVPLVLISAGVGLTPMLSMLHAAAIEAADRPIWFVHGTRNGSAHALKAEVASLVAKRTSFKSQIHFSQPDKADRVGTDYDAVGHITARSLLALNAGADAHYMLCGPAKFLSDIRQGLESAGVPSAQIHFEVFGPTG